MISFTVDGANRGELLNQAALRLAEYIGLPARLVEGQASEVLVEPAHGRVTINRGYVAEHMEVAPLTTGADGKVSRWRAVVRLPL